jgi:hypothetical protein
MQQVVQKAQGASEPRRFGEGRDAGADQDRDHEARHGGGEKRAGGRRKEGGDEIGELPLPRKAMRKRMRKFRQRLLSIRSGWHEAFDGEADCEREGGGLASKSGGGGGGRGSRLSRLLSDLVKSAPRKDRLDEEWAPDKGRGDGAGDGAQGGGGGGGGAQRDERAAGMERNLRELLLVLTSCPQDRTSSVASVSERSGGGRWREGGREGRDARDGSGAGMGAEDLDKESMLVMVRKSGGMAALTRLLASADAATPVEAALRVRMPGCGWAVFRVAGGRYSE